MSRAAITIKWEPDTEEETVIKYTKQYEALSNLEKADMLKDAVYALNREYRNVLKKGIVS